MRVTICFADSRPSLSEFAAVRRSLPEFRDAAPATLKEKIGESGTLQLGVMPTDEARKIVQELQSQGLRVVAEDASEVGYLPLDRTIGCAWLIENKVESEAIVQEMLAAGVPVQDA